MSGIRDGVIQFFRSKNFCLTVPKIFVGEPFCAVFQKISGIEKFYRKEGGAVSGFSIENFCLTEPKFFLGEPFFVSQIFRYQKILGIRGGGCHDSPSKTVLSHSAEKFRRRPL